MRVYTTIDKPTLSDIGAASSGHSHSAASTSAAGLMSAADKKKLDGIVLEEETDANIDKIIAGTYA